MTDIHSDELDRMLQDCELASQLLESGLEREVGQASARKRRAPAKKKGQSELDLFANQSIADWDRVKSELTKRISEIKAARLEQVWALEQRLSPVVQAMQATGIRVDQDRLKQFIQGELAKASACEAGIQKNFLTRINLSSPQQLLEALSSLGLNLESTKADVLTNLAHPVAGEIIAWRSLVGGARQAESYYDAIGTDGRIHPTFDQFGAATGRFACKEPNLQSVGRNKELRACFIPAAGCKFIIADYSQIELRLAALLAKDETMLQAFRDGKDIHAITAAKVLGKPVETVTKQDRQLAKAVNFGLLYGQGAKGLMNYAKNNYGVTLVDDQAEQFRSAFFEAYPGIRIWHQQVWQGARNPKTTEARTLLGRRRTLLPINGDKLREWDRFTTLINHPVQGLGGDIIKLAMCELADALRTTTARMVLTVHDELVVETPVAIVNQIRTIVEKAMVQAADDITGDKGLVLAESTVADSWADK